MSELKHLDAELAGKGDAELAGKGDGSCFLGANISYISSIHLFLCHIFSFFFCTRATSPKLVLTFCSNEILGFRK